MHLYLRADSTHLSEGRAKTLDDEFFLSHPVAYFVSRMSSLLTAERNVSVPTPTNEPDFFNALGLTPTDKLLVFEEQDRRLQVAVEALSLRHQAAEALLRFMYAVTAAKPKEGDAPSTWLAIADSPNALIDVVKRPFLPWVPTKSCSCDASSRLARASTRTWPLQQRPPGHG